MIVKEKENTNIQTNNSTIESTTQKNERYYISWKTFISVVILVTVILTLVVVYILHMFGMEIHNPYETKVISINSEGKNWYKNENINIFEKLNKSGEKVIWPGKSGTYDFVIENNTKQSAYYRIDFEEINENNINIKYRLRMNNVYISRK